MGGVLDDLDTELSRVAMYDSRGRNVARMAREFYPAYFRHLARMVRQEIRTLLNSLSVTLYDVESTAVIVDGERLALPDIIDAFLDLLPDVYLGNYIP